MIIKNYLDKSIWPSLLLFPLANMGLFFFFSDRGTSFTNYDAHTIVNQILILIFVAVAEELFFRGLLIRELVLSYKWRPTMASLLISFVFGIMHLVNINSYTTWCYAIVQCICAFAVSFNLSAIFIRTQSLWICVLIHAFINITSIGLDIGNHTAQLTVSSKEAIIFLLVSFIYLVSGIKMLNHKMVEGN